MRLIMLTIMASKYSANTAVDVGIEGLCEVIRSYTSNVRVREAAGTLIAEHARLSQIIISGFGHYTVWLPLRPA